MNIISMKPDKFKNQDSPISEIFSILKHYKTSSDGLSHLDYSINELKILHQHIENTINMTSTLMQNIGQMIYSSQTPSNIKFESMKETGLLIALFGDLIKALSVLQIESNNELCR